MSVLSDLRCLSCLAIFESLVKPGTPASVACPECGHPETKRLIGAPRLLSTSCADGTASSDAMTTTIDKWEKMRKQKLKIEQRNLERHGTYD